MVDGTQEKMVAPTRAKKLKSLSLIFGYQHRFVSRFPRTSNLAPCSSLLDPRSSFLDPRSSFLYPRSSLLAPRTSSAGFTLMELVVVMVLVSLAAALVVPRLPSTGSMALKSSARATAAMLRYLGERSVGSKNIYRLHINISENSLRITRKLPNGEELPPDDQLLTRRLLESGVTITDLQTPRLGKVTEGEVLMDFGAAGLSEFLTLHLSSTKGESFTVIGYPTSGKIKLLAGYQELTL